MSMTLEILAGLMTVVSRFALPDRVLRRLSLMYLDVSRGYSYDIDRNGELQLLHALARVLQYPVCFLDVGANIGRWTARATEIFPDYHGHLFEPAPTTFANLCQALGPDDRLRLNAVALTDEAGLKPFKCYGENSGKSTLLTEASYFQRPSTVIDVRSERGDDYCRRTGIERINLLKVDAEGADLFVLRGFSGMFAAQRIDVVQFEYGYTSADAHTSMRDFFEFFEHRGYALGPLRQRGVRFKTFEYTDNEYRSGPNYVACLPRFRQSLSAF